MPKHWKNSAKDNHLAAANTTMLWRLKTDKLCLKISINSINIWKVETEFSSEDVIEYLKIKRLK